MSNQKRDSQDRTSFEKRDHAVQHVRLLSKKEKEFTCLVVILNAASNAMSSSSKKTPVESSTNASLAEFNMDISLFNKYHSNLKNKREKSIKKNKINKQNFDFLLFFSFLLFLLFFRSRYLFFLRNGHGKTINGHGNSVKGQGHVLFQDDFSDFSECEVIFSHDRTREVAFETS